MIPKSEIFDISRSFFGALQSEEVKPYTIYLQTKQEITDYVTCQRDIEFIVSVKELLERDRWRWSISNNGFGILQKISCKNHTKNFIFEMEHFIIT